ncbi:PAC2 [Enterospora canceri]|uniref:PAC2 n=1 Tax=Enterospora canceri TaxID=1081671 RepID=A0A1Y1S3Y5_9MICR|nr:PAC2 [Enterospora canceri]
MIIALAAENLIPSVHNRKDISCAKINKNRIYIYNEDDTKIRRWTDRRQWTPSRVYGCFLLYKEMNGALCKKTFSLATDLGKYHIVIYSSKNVEEMKLCCGEKSSIGRLYEKYLKEFPVLKTRGLFNYASTKTTVPKYRQNRRKMVFDAEECKETLQKLRHEDQMMKYCFPDKSDQKISTFKNIFSFSSESNQNGTELRGDVTTKSAIMFDRTIPLNDGLINRKKDNSQ